MDRSIIEASFSEVKVIHCYPESGQKYVYLIQHPLFDVVILKIVKDMNERIAREISILSDNNFAYTPKILETNVIEINGKKYTYMIEQYIEGDVLKLAIENHEFSLVRSLNLLEALLKIATELEKAKIVHRDIKPDNIICCPAGDFYLIDFGIARLLESSSLTYTQAAVGPHTPGYGAPELFQYRKKDIDIRSDLFSIGVVIYETIFYNHPFITGNEMNINEIWFKTATIVPKDVIIIGDNDRKLIGFLQTLMQKHVSRRPPSAEKALEWFYIIKESITINDKDVM